MFDVVLNDGREMPDSDIYYIIAKEGIFLKKKLGIMDSIAPVKNISILESVAASAKMNINKIPAADLAKVHSFFKEVYRQYRAEAIVLLFYNEETGEHKIIPPKQKVTMAACDYDKGISIDGFTMIGTIHSHGSMSAFHSGTDDHDEEHFDGLHITLGHLNDDYQSISASIVANGFRVVIEPMEYVDGVFLIEETNTVDKKEITTTYKMENGKLVVDKVQEIPQYQTYWTRSKYSRRYDLNVEDSEREFNEKWMDLVERGVFQYQYNKNSRFVGGRGYTPGVRQNKWGRGYDPYAWGDDFSHPPAIPPLSKTATTSTNKTGKVLETVDGEKLPCVSCTHRDCKMFDEMNDEEYVDYYICTKCNVLVEDESDTILQCLSCLSNEHLVPLDDDSELLTDNYTKASPNQPPLMDAFTDDPETESDYLTCKVCNNIFHVIEEDYRCPFCFTILYEESDEMEVYKGRSIYEEEDEVNERAIQEALGSENPITKIPEPHSNTVPIPEKKDASLMEKFKQVFGGGK